MTKEEVLAKLEEYKDRQIEIGLADEGQLVYSGIEGHWLFVKNNCLVYIRSNIFNGTQGVYHNSQTQNPFIIYTIPFDVVSYVKTYISNDESDIESKLDGLTPVGTSKTLAEITKEIESATVRKACSPRGNLNVHDVAPGGVYGRFTGSAISTDIEGLPKYMKEDIN